MPARPRVVLDNNVLVSGLLKPEGIPGRIVRAWRERRFLLLYSLPLFEETVEVLQRPRFRSRIPDTEMVGLLLLIRRYGVSVELRTSLNYDLEPNDLAVLATAVDGQATHIVTGDQRIQSVGECRGIPILTPRGFLAVLKAVAGPDDPAE